MAAILTLHLACSSTRKPPPVDEALLGAIELAEWRYWPGTRDGELLRLAEEALGDVSAELRWRAAAFLGRKMPVGADQVLLKRFEVEEDSLVRREIISALASLDSELAAEALRRLAFARSEGEIRTLAIASLGGRKEDQDVLRQAISSTVAGQRLAAGLALIRHPVADRAAGLDAALAGEKDERVRWVFTEALRLSAAGDGSEWSGRFCDLLADDNFLVSMAASRAVQEYRPGEACFDKVVTLARAPARAWLARLGAALVVGAWLERDGEGGDLLAAAARKGLEELVVERVGGVLADRVPQAALRRAWLRNLTLCRGEPARELMKKVERGRGLVPGGSVGGAFIGKGARRLDSIPVEPPAYTEPPFERSSPFRLARLRPPRLCLLAAGGKKIYIEVFLSSAPNHVSAILHLARRGAFSGLRLRRLEEPIGLLIDPAVEGADPVAGCALAVETSSRRILRGTIISHPGYRGGGRLFIAGRPLPEWEGRVAVLGRILIGQRELAGLAEGSEIDLVEP